MSTAALDRPSRVAPVAVALGAYGVLLAHDLGASAAVVVLLAALTTGSLEARLGLWLAVRLATFAGYVPAEYASVVLVVLVATALVRRLSAGQEVKGPPALAPWTLLLAVVALNLFLHGAAVEQRVYAWQVFVENFLVLILLSNSPPRLDRGRGAVAVLAAVTAFVAGFAAVERLVGHPLLTSLSAARSAYLPTLERSTFAGVQRLGSLFFNADWMAVVLTFGLAVWVGTALATRGSWRTAATAVASGMLALAFATLTRSVFIGAPAAFLAIFVVRRSGDRWSLVARATVLVLAVVCLAPGLTHTALGRLEDPAQKDLRLGAARTALDVIEARPLVGLGMGWDRYIQAAEPYRDVSRQYIPLAHPHNSYLELGAMLGLPALGAFAALMWVGARGGRRGRLSGSETAAFAGAAVLLVMSLTVNAVTLPFMSTLFWVAWWVVASSDGRDSQDGVDLASAAAR